MTIEKSFSNVVRVDFELNFRVFEASRVFSAIIESKNTRDNLSEITGIECGLCQWDDEIPHNSRSLILSINQLLAQNQHNRNRTTIRRCRRRQCAGGKNVWNASTSFIA